MRIAALVFTLFMIFSAIAAILWYQEIQYLLPTPVPKKHRVVLLNKNSNFVQMALDSRMAYKEAAHFEELATQSNGCSISEEQDIFPIP